MTVRLLQFYKDTIVPAMQEKFGYENPMQIPKMQKVTINVGAGPKHGMNFDAVAENIKKITGQSPVKTFAKKSISNFKIREGQEIGLKVTLRGPRMYEFVDRFVNFALPRVHDFRGLSANAFDQQGNYTVGLKDQLAFPEIQAESMEQLHGLQVVVTTTASNKEEGYELLKLFGFPLKEAKKKKVK